MAQILTRLQELFPDSSKATLRSWIKEGRILINNTVAKRPDDEVADNATVLLAPKAVRMPHDLKILYQDHELIAIEKPCGLLTVATHFETKKTVHAILKEHFRPKRVHVVHRLDQDTSGVLIFALNEQMRDQLKVIFEKHEINREYEAIVEGRVAERQGRWESYLYEDAAYKVHSTQNPEGGEHAITLFERLEVLPKYTHLRLTLHTGKKNQIRVHCSAAGHPVAGDKKYGAQTDPGRRVLLHARRLSFTHPLSKKQISFESPLPEVFGKMIKRSPHVSQ